MSLSSLRRSILAVRSLNSVITNIIDTFNTNKIYIMYTINRFGENGNGKLGRAAMEDAWRTVGNSRKERDAAATNGYTDKEDTRENLLRDV